MKTAVEWLKEIYDSCNTYEKFISNSDWEEANKMDKEQKIKSKIEAVNHFCKLNGFADTNMHKSVVDMYEKQMKK